MKKTYTRPQIIVEEFSANEYIAACGDSGTTYKFKCDAPGGLAILTDGNLELGLYRPCNATHEASVTSDFSKGYVVTVSGTRKVIVWTDGGTDIHCTTNLNQSSWETSKS